MVIDNRSNRENDFHQAAAVTVTGVVKEVEGLGKGPLLRLYLSKHPYLKDFVSSPTCALLRMHVETYYVVRQFQNVMELHIRKWVWSLHFNDLKRRTENKFGGAFSLTILSQIGMNVPDGLCVKKEEPWLKGPLLIITTNNWKAS